MQASVVGELDIHRFVCESIDSAPDATGIYAWYGVPRIGVADWKDLTSGERRLRDLLRRHTERMMDQPIRLHARSRFGATWDGEMVNTTLRYLAAALSGVPIEKKNETEDESEDSVRAPKLQDSLKHESTRSVLVSALQACAPIFSTPLYIGVADKLRRRLREHREELYEYDEAVTSGKWTRDAVRFRGSFAARAVGADFSPDQLVVYAWNLEPLAPEISDLRDLAEALEWLLNRWNRPVFGRR